MRSQSDEEMVDLIEYFKQNDALIQRLKDLYHSYHIEDSTRPVELRTLDLSDPTILSKQMEKILASIWPYIDPNIQQVLRRERGLLLVKVSV